jgi:hypothetical protein
LRTRLLTLSLLLSASLISIAPKPSLATINPLATAGDMPSQIGSRPASQLPLFIANVGQFDAGVRFQVRGQSSTLFLADDALWLTMLDPEVTPPQRQKSEAIGSVSLGEPLRGTAAPRLRGVNIKLSFVGANIHPQLEPFEPSDSHVSFFRSDQANWHADVPVWGGVRYRDLYPGIDLELHGARGQLEQRLRARPGANLSAVRLRVHGAEAQTIVGDYLRLQTAAGTVSLPLLQVEASDPTPTLPLTLPTIEGTDVRAPFARPAFQSAAAPAPQNALGIGYSTLFGGTFDDIVSDLVVGNDGSTYITGYTFSPDFPTTPGAFDSTCGNDAAKLCNYDGDLYYYDAFVAKLDPAGTSRVYSTFLGGRNGEFGNGIAIDATGAAYVTGKTWSPDFPTTNNAFDPDCGDDGNCSYDSYSSYIPDGFVVKLNPTGTALNYATFLGDLIDDWGNAVAVDGAGNAYVTGVTYSPDFPTTSGAFDRECGTDAQCTYDSTDNTVRPDAFVTKLNATGTDLIYSTFLGASNYDQGYDIAIDQSGNAYITGNTTSDDLPTTTGASDPTCGIDGTCDFDGDDTVYYDGFVTKINPSGSNLVYLTYLGGVRGDGGFAIALDQAGAAYITGYTYSTSGFPASAGAFDPSFNGLQDAFAVKLNPAGSALSYATLLGGADIDDGRNIVVDSDGNAYIAGLTFSDNFPTSPDGYDATFNGGDDAYVAKIDPTGTQLAYSTFLGGESTDEAYGIGLDVNGGVYVAGLTSSPNFPVTTGAAYAPGNCISDTDTYACYDSFVTKLVPVVGQAPENTRMYLAMALYTPYVPPPVDPLCDEFEPNNSRHTSPSSINLATTITAKICQKEGLSQADPYSEDNYRIRTTQARPLQVKLTLPPSLLGHIALLVYDSKGLTNHLPGCYIDIVRTTPYTMNCPLPAEAGAYVVRLYSDKDVFDNIQPYTLHVAQ